MPNRAVEHNVAAFSELPFAVHWQGRLALQITALTNELLTTAMMVDNLAEKVEKCPINQVVKYCLHTIGTTKAVRYTE